jgi:hypothetical protein
MINADCYLGGSAGNGYVAHDSDEEFCSIASGPLLPVATGCSRLKPVTRACECYRQPVPLVGSYRYQEVGNDVTPKWAIHKFSEFTHLVSQLDHACSRFGLCSPEEFGRPLGIRKIVAVGAPMQTRP